MVTDSTVVTMDSLQETTIALSNGTIADPYNLPYPKNGVQKAPCRTTSQRAATWQI